MRYYSHLNEESRKFWGPVNHDNNSFEDLIFDGVLIKLLRSYLCGYVDQSQGLDIGQTISYLEVFSKLGPLEKTPDIPQRDNHLGEKYRAMVPYAEVIYLDGMAIRLEVFGKKIELPESLRYWTWGINLYVHLVCRFPRLILSPNFRWSISSIIKAEMGIALRSSDWNTKGRATCDLINYDEISRYLSDPNGLAAISEGEILASDLREAIGTIPPFQKSHDISFNGNDSGYPHLPDELLQAVIEESWEHQTTFPGRSLNIPPDHPAASHRFPFATVSSALLDPESIKLEVDDPDSYFEFHP